MAMRRQRGIFPIMILVLHPCVAYPFERLHPKAGLHPQIPEGQAPGGGGGAPSPGGASEAEPQGGAPGGGIGADERGVVARVSILGIRV